MSLAGIAPGARAKDRTFPLLALFVAGKFFPGSELPGDSRRSGLPYLPSPAFLVGGDVPFKAAYRRAHPDVRSAARLACDVTAPEPPVPLAAPHCRLPMASPRVAGIAGSITSSLASLAAVDPVPGG